MGCSSTSLSPTAWGAWASPVVPDPYDGGAHEFEHVLDLVEDACEGLLHHVKQQTIY